MDFQLSQEQQLIRRNVRELAEREFAPRAGEHDRTGEFPQRNVGLLAEYGYLGMMCPPEYGGGGADVLTHSICMEEVARACAATAVIMEVHNTLHCDPLMAFGTTEQKQRFLPDLAIGKKLGAFALTEPESGSDAGAMRTTAVRRGDEYILNGSKAFITNGGVADLYLVFATVDRSLGTKGIAAFLVPKDALGISFGRPEDKLGIRASHTTTIILDNCSVPAEDRLGDEGQGFKIAMATLDGGRIGIGAQAVGIAQAALDACVTYAQERQQFGEPIGSFQAIQWKIADMATEIEAARWLVYRAAWLKEQPGRWTQEIAKAKLFASEAAMRATVNAVQVFGGYGYIREYNVERYMRDAKITEIYEGTSEIQRLIIASNLLRDLNVKERVEKPARAAAGR